MRSRRWHLVVPTCDPTSLDLASTRGCDTTAAMPVDTGRGVDGVSDGGFGTDDFADEVLSDDVVDFDPNSAWGRGDEITAALPDGAPAVGTDVDVDTDVTPPAVADDAYAFAHSPADDGDAVAAHSAREAAIPSPKKRRSSCGPAHEARRKAFYASKKARTTSAPSTQGGAGTSTKGADGRGV